MSLDNMIVVKRELFRIDHPVLTITSNRIRINQIAYEALGNPQNISAHADFAMQTIVITAVNKAQDKSLFLRDLFSTMQWDPSYKYQLYGKLHDRKLIFKLRPVLVMQKK